MSPSHLRQGLGLTLLLCCAAPAAARADEADDLQRRTEARTLGAQGDALWEAGRCDRAIAMWQQAEARFHAPTLVFRIARCEAMLGRVVQATAHFEALVSEPLAPGAPPSWVEAKESGARWLSGVKERIARLTVVAEPVAPGLTLTAELDGVPFELGSPRLSDPGKHRLSVRAGGEAWTEAVDLDDGAQREVRVAAGLEPAPPPVRWKRRLGWGLVGGGALVAGVGGLGFGLQALANSRTLAKECTDFLCVPTAQPDITRLQTNSMWADVSLGVGVVLAAAGTVILIVSPEAKDEGPKVRIVPLGPGVGLVGSF